MEGKREQFCLLHAFQIEPGRHLEIAVSDTGAGIGKGDLQHIFEPFFTTKAIAKGPAWASPWSTERSSATGE